jgi:hypothetical protein
MKNNGNSIFLKDDKFEENKKDSSWPKKVSFFYLKYKKKIWFFIKMP